MSNIKLIVGLANPGKIYSQTRHNAGAWCVDNLAGQLHQSLSNEPKFFGHTTRIKIEMQEVRLLIPSTFMNLSGKSVAACAHFYRIKTNEILVVHDDLDLLPGRAKIKLGGGNGGHNGLKDIQNSLSNDPNFYRLRIGIGHPGDKNKVTSFVLSSPNENERSYINAAIHEAIQAIICWCKEGNPTNAINQLHAFKAKN